MALYDVITSDYPLPNPALRGEEFQTKDLGQTLSRYRITAEGWLCRSREVVDIFGEGDRPPGPKEPKSTEDTHYHSDLTFYTYTEENRVEYRARFTHGTVEWIRRKTEE